MKVARNQIYPCECGGLYFPTIGVLEKPYKRVIIEVYNFPFKECFLCGEQLELYGDFMQAERYAKQMFNRYGARYIDFELAPEELAAV